MIQVFQIVMPQAVPTKAMIDAWITEKLRRECLATYQDTTGNISTFEIAERVACTLCHFPHIATKMPDDAGNPDDRTHDAYFHVQRLENDAPAIFVRMILWARFLLLQDVDEAPVTISADRLHRIDLSLFLLLQHTLGTFSGLNPNVGVWQTRGSDSSPMARWVRGHQIFATLTQGLIFAFHSLDTAMRSGDEQGIGHTLDLAVSLLEGSAAAFEFTGDFTPDDYESTIRPSMMPPIALEPLSGTMSVDHRHLVQLMREMRPTLNALRVRDSVRHDRLAQALAHVYDSHKHVCSRFVGVKRSLIMAETSQKTGTELIEQFKKVRMKVFEPTDAPRKEIQPTASSFSGH